MSLAEELAMVHEELARQKEEVARFQEELHSRTDRSEVSKLESDLQRKGES